MKFPRNEIWCRKAFRKDILEESLQVIYRPDDRICRKGKKKCFYEGEEVVIRILRKPGDDERAVEPIFCRGGKRAVIRKMSVVDVNNLTQKDFEKSWKNVNSAKDLKYFFGLLYNKSPEQFQRATKIEIEYLK